MKNATKKLFVLIIFSSIISIIAFSCSGGEMEQKKVTYNSLKDIPDAAWEKLSQKKIFFGHQSVGFNIIDGIQDLIKEYPQIKLNIVETNNPDDIKGGGFAHARIGSNKDVLSKITDFGNFMKKGWGNKADIAFMKLCFVDINESSDVTKNFKQYQNEMAVLKADYPKTSFIHLTVPLTYQKGTWKTWLKKMMRKKQIWEYDGNIKKNEFNQLIRQTYSGTEPVLDIAQIESTLPDGTRSTFEVAGKTYYQMAPGYTYDDGHLNEQGRKRVAAGLLILLVNER